MDDLASTLSVMIRSHKGSTFFLNGGPGSGKSFALQEAAQALNEHQPDCLVIGPLLPSSVECRQICALTLQALDNKGYVDSVPDGITSLPELWQWASENVHINKNKILIMVDLPPASLEDIPDLCTFFSQARYIEAHNPWDGHLAYAICGSWDHIALYDAYEKIHTSFPYTLSNNYFLWNGISENAMIVMCEKELPTGPLTNLTARLLFEITGGNPAIAISLLDRIKEVENYSLADLLRLLKSVIIASPIADRFVAIIKALPTDSLEYLSNLLDQKKFRLPRILPPHVERLQTAGLIQMELVGNSAYGGLRSWFIEGLLRARFTEIGLKSKSADIGLEKFVPHVTAISIDAFQLVHQIENLIRNFVTVQLWQGYKPDSSHPLSDRVMKFNEYKKLEESAYDRALDWMERNRQRNMNSILLNPEIAYLSTRDLAILVKEIGNENNWKSWQQIGDQIENLIGIRDAVMHNQIIDLADLEKLHKLREKIYLALNE